MRHLSGRQRSIQTIHDPAEILSNADIGRRDDPVTPLPADRAAHRINGQSPHQGLGLSLLNGPESPLPNPYCGVRCPTLGSTSSANSRSEFFQAPGLSA